MEIQGIGEAQVHQIPRATQMGIRSPPFTRSHGTAPARRGVNAPGRWGRRRPESEVRRPEVTQQRNEIACPLVGPEELGIGHQHDALDSGDHRSQALRP
jgi:hypothetical protein